MYRSKTVAVMTERGGICNYSKKKLIDYGDAKLKA